MIQSAVMPNIPLADSWEIYDNSGETPRLVAVNDADGLQIAMQEKMEKIMTHKVKEPEPEYLPDAIDRAVQRAIAKELDRKRKLGLPIVIGRDGKVVIMVGDKVVAERAYGEQPEKRLHR